MPPSAFRHVRLGLPAYLRADQLHFPAIGFLQGTRQHPPLPVGQSPHRFGFDDVIAREELATPRASQAPLAHQKVPNGPAVRGVRTVENDFRGGDLAERDAALQGRAGEPDLIGSLERAQTLRLRGLQGGLRHVLLSLPNVRSAAADVDQ